MAEKAPSDQKPQSGARVALGVLGFIVGTIIIVYIIKQLFGM